MKIVAKNEFQFHLPVSYNFGNCSSEKLPMICKKFGKKGLLIIPKNISLIEKRIRRILDKSNVNIDIFYLEEGEPTTTFIDTSAKKMEKHHFDFIIGLGGGSALDFAKTISLKFTNNDPIWEYANLSYRKPKKIKNKSIPVIAIPTTAGTGSEFTPYAVLDNNEINQKGTIQDKILFPKEAIIDPSLMLTMPKELTISTGLDAFSHALESYINKSKVSPLSEYFAIKSMQLIFENLPKVVKQPQNLNFRSNMAFASSLAGMAISHRGTTTIHAIAEPLGALTHIPHGHCVSISILPVLKRTKKYATKQFSELYRHIFLNSEKNSVKRADLFLIEVENLIELLKIKQNVSEYNQKKSLDKLKSELLENIIKYKFRPLKQHPNEFSKRMINSTISEIIGK